MKASSEDQLLFPGFRLSLSLSLSCLLCACVCLCPAVLCVQICCPHDSSCAVLLILNPLSDAGGPLSSSLLRFSLSLSLSFRGRFASGIRRTARKERREKQRPKRRQRGMGSVIYEACSPVAVVVVGRGTDTHAAQHNKHCVTAMAVGSW